MFSPTLNDAGAGIVTTTLNRGVGSATFTRASTAYTKLSTGLWASIASGSPRYCYTGMDTTVKTTGGYLSEVAATQLVTPTAAIRDMSDASWVKVTATAVKNATGIDGVANSASTLTATGVTSTILQTLVAAATSRTYSCWIRRKTGTGTIILKHGTATLDVTALINASTYTLVQLNDNELNVAYGIQITTSGDAIEVDFNQFEAGADATSPIDTAAATRVKDTLSYSTVGNIDFTQGAAYGEYTMNGTSGGTFIGVTSGGSGVHYVPSGMANTVIRQNDSTTSCTKSGLTSLATGIRKRASSWGATGQSITGDGAVVAAAVFDGTIGAAGIISIGNVNGSSQCNGIIKSIRIYGTQLPNSTLQALTA